MPEPSVPELLVVVLTVTGRETAAAVGAVDRPGEVLAEAVRTRSADLLADVADVLDRLAVGDRGAHLLALAVAVSGDVARTDAGRLSAALGDELSDGWGLPALLPVLRGDAASWTAAGAPTARPLVAGAVVAAARSVGAHAHLPRTGPT